MALLAAAFANDGVVMKPYMVERVVTPNGITLEQHRSEKWFEATTAARASLIHGFMEEVVQEGTGTAAALRGVRVAGKTGTAENYVKINGKRMQLTDHSIFVAFAPAEDPKIAIAVFVENGYYGARVAAPIASLMIEKYLKGEVYRCALETRMLETSLEHEYAKPYSGQPFTINR
mgnify:CR=1 FL=1